MMNRSLAYEDKSETLAGFGIGERLFIWGFRAVAQCHRLGWPSMHDLRQVYDHFGVADAVPSLDSMLEFFACTAHSSIELHCPGCPCVSDGECRLLRAISTARQGEIDLSRQQFEQWLPDIAVDWIMAPVCGLVRIFADAGLSLPVRQTNPSPIRETMSMRSWPIGSPTLH
jgi:hypothetical protein